MDKYGFGGLVRNLIKRARDDMRQTGRTTSMLDRIRPDDIVVFHRHDSAKWFERQAREAGKKVNTVVVDPNSPGRLSELSRGRSRRLVLDHEWVEIYIEQAVNAACTDIDIFEREMESFESPRFEGKW